jgi:hypothetical protein
MQTNKQKAVGLTAMSEAGKMRECKKAFISSDA